METPQPTGSSTIGIFACGLYSPIPTTGISSLMMIIMIVMIMMVVAAAAMVILCFS
jgi:hypothetical protein